MQPFTLPFFEAVVQNADFFGWQSALASIVTDHYDTLCPAAFGTYLGAVAFIADSAYSAATAAFADPPEPLALARLEGLYVGFTRALAEVSPDSAFVFTSDVGVFGSWANSLAVIALAPDPPASAICAGATLLRTSVRAAVHGRPGPDAPLLVVDRADAFARRLYAQLGVGDVDWTAPDFENPRVRTMVDLFPALYSGALSEMFPAMFAPNAPSKIGVTVVKALKRMLAERSGEFEEFAAKVELPKFFARVADEIAPGVRWVAGKGAVLDDRPRTLSPAVMAFWRLVATGVAKVKTGAPVEFPGLPKRTAGGDGSGKAEGPVLPGQGWIREGGAEWADVFRDTFWAVFCTQRATEDARDEVLDRNRRDDGGR